MALAEGIIFYLRLKEDIMNAMEDKYPQVAIKASAIAYQISCKNFCCSDNMDLSLMFINYLLCADKKYLLLKQSKKVHEIKERNYNAKAACIYFHTSFGLASNNQEFGK